MRAWIGLAALWVAVGTVGTSRTRDSAFREDEVECEEAVAHLLECCPGLRRQQFFCDHIASFGCSPGRSPDFAKSESRFIRDQSCQELRDGDTCTWAAGVAAQPDSPPPEESF